MSVGWLGLEEIYYLIYYVTKFGIADISRKDDLFLQTTSWTDHEWIWHQTNMQSKYIRGVDEGSQPNLELKTETTFTKPQTQVF